jgi:hypothetical protein
MTFASILVVANEIRLVICTRFLGESANRTILGSYGAVSGRCRLSHIINVAFTGLHGNLLERDNAVGVGISCRSQVREGEMEEVTVKYELCIDPLS